MAIYKGLLGFIEHFESEEACKDYLCSRKWGQGFECKSVATPDTSKEHLSTIDVVSAVNTTNRVLLILYFTR